MPLVVFGALFPRGFGEEEGAPVRDSADDAAGGEDEGAGCAGDSVRGGVLDGGGGGWMGGLEGGTDSLISEMPRPGRTWRMLELCWMGRNWSAYHSY